MFGKLRSSHWLVGAAILALIDCAGVAAIELSMISPAQAQFDQGFYPFRRHVPRSGGFFQQLFGPSNSRHYQREEERSAPSQHVDHLRAPLPPKPDKDVTPTTTILVMGDGMSDWLGYGLEEAFSDTPEVAVVRKDKQRSGLIRYDTKGDLDWWHAVRDILTKEKANYVVMMIGLNDRENIREKDVAKEDEKQKAEKEQAKNAADKGTQAAQKKDQPAGTAPDDKQAAEGGQDIVVPESKGASNGVIAFRSDLWAKVYSRRIDETIAALKSKGVPVFWVGLPSIRGTKSTADAVYLNDLFRARAERAGINYIDVWDGFVDDSGKYSTFGPDYEGQIRKLRTADGVYFTRYGARKLAHYVEREIRRYMTNRALPVALPSGPIVPAPEGGKSAVRPVAGPVVPLTVTTGNSDQLLGAPGSRATYGDAIANDVLVKGETVRAQPGRADDFAWQPSGSGAADNGSAPAAQTQAPGSGSATTAVRQVEPTKQGEIEARTDAGNKPDVGTNADVGTRGPSKPTKDAAKPKTTKQAGNAAAKRAPHKRSNFLIPPAPIR